MIFEWLFQVVDLVVSYLLLLVPVLEFPISFISGVGSLMSLLSFVSWFIPAHAFIVCMSVALVVFQWANLVFIWNWVIQRVVK